MTDIPTRGKTISELQPLNLIDGNSLLVVHVSGESYSMTYNQLLAAIGKDLSLGAFDDIGTRFFSDRTVTPAGCLNCMDGAIYTNANTLYPELWAKLINGQIATITMNQYETELARRFGANDSLSGVCGSIGLDIPNRTFRMPTYPNGRVAMVAGSTNGTFRRDQIVNIIGQTHAQDGYLRGPANSGAFRSWHSAPGSTRSGDGGWSAYYGIFDASAVVATGDQVRNPSTEHRLYMVVSTLRWEITNIYVTSTEFQNEVVNRQNANVQISNTLVAMQQQIDGALQTYYRDTYSELQAFVRDNSSILQVGNILICGGGNTGEPIRQFLWSGNQMLEISANIVLDNMYTKQQVDNFLELKVDKIDGMGLSQNSYTNSEKIRLSQSVLEPEYTAFKNNTNDSLDILENNINQEQINRENQNIISGSTSGEDGTELVNPVLVLTKEDTSNVLINLDVLTKYLNKQSKGTNGNLSIINQNGVDEEGVDEEGVTEDEGTFELKDVKTSENCTTYIKTRRLAGNPTRLELGLIHNVNTLDSVRLVLLNNGTNKRVYLLKDKERAPYTTAEVNANDEVMNKGEIWTRIDDVVSQAISGVLPLPTVLDKESNLPDISAGATEVYYFVIDHMDISEPNVDRQGRAWCGVGATSWETIIDIVNSLSETMFKQLPDSTWVLSDSILALINGAVQSNQLTTSNPNSSSTDSQVSTAKAVYNYGETKIDKSSIQVIEPDEASTDSQLTSAKRLKLMIGAALSTLKTTSKNIVGSLNELFDSKANISMNNLNQAGIEKIAELASGVNQNNLGQIVYSLVPIIDSKLHLADGTLIGQEGEYEKFNEYLQNLINLYPQIFCTQAEWDNSVNTYGMCSKFVIDNVNETIRLPLLKGYNKGVNSIVGLGEVNEAGLPNITGTLGTTDDDTYTKIGTATGCFEAGVHIGRVPAASPLDNIAPQIANFDASLSNPIYGNSTTVTPEGYNTLIYIVLGTTNQVAVEVLNEYEIANTVPFGAPLWTDHKIEDVNYLLSDGQWNDGALYPDIYDLLVKQYNDSGSVMKTVISGNKTIQYWVTPLKLNLVDQHQDLTDLDSQYGFSCWQIDFENARFRLPINTKKKILSWESEWFVPTVNTVKEFDLTDNIVLDATISKRKLKCIFRVTTAIANYQVGDILYQDAQSNWYYHPGNYDMEEGFSTTFRGNSLRVAQGSDYMITAVDANGGTARLNRAHVEMKVIVEGEVEDGFLYYKVANAVENINRVNLNRLIDTTGNKTDKDGTNMTKGYKPVNEFELEGGETEIVVDLVSGKKNIINMEYKPVTNATILFAQFSTDGGITWINSAIYNSTSLDRSIKGGLVNQWNGVENQTGFRFGVVSEGNLTQYIGNYNSSNIKIEINDGEDIKSMIADHIVSTNLNTAAEPLYIYYENWHGITNARTITSPITNIKFYMSSGAFQSAKVKHDVIL